MSAFRAALRNTRTSSPMLQAKERPMKLTCTHSLIASGLLLISLLAGCGGGSGGNNPPAAKTLEGQVLDSSGAAVAGATVKLLTPAGTLVGSDQTDADGRYRFSVQSAQYTVQASRTVEGARSRSALLVDLSDPAGGAAQAIVLADLLSHELPVVQGRAETAGVQISGVPDSVERLWVLPGEASDRTLFPGDAFTTQDSFASLGYAWFGAADAQGQPVSQFDPPLQVHLRLTADAQRQLTDATPDNGQIDVAMVSFDADLGVWQNETSGVLVDAQDQVLPESALAGLQDGSDTQAVRVRFPAPHFSAYSAALFFRTGLPDFSDRNAAPLRKHLRPEIAFNTGNRYVDMWLGASVAGEDEPRAGDPSDDGMVVCGSQTWLELSQHVGSGLRPVRGYLNVFQQLGPLPDVDGEEFDGQVAFGRSDWAIQNQVVDDWVGPWGPIKKAYVQIGSLASDVGVGTTESTGSHNGGYTRVMLTRTPLTDQQAINSATFESGETEDYLSSCDYRLRVSVRGEGEDRVAVRQLSCGPEDDCEVGVANGSQLELRATRNGEAIDVDWSLHAASSTPPACARGSTCTFRRQDDGAVRNSRFGAHAAAVALFPDYPELLVSISGQGRVQELGLTLDCDARDPGQRPSSDDCRADFPGASSVTLVAEPAPQFSFAGWGPVACAEGSQTGAQCTVPVADDQRTRQRARFVPFPVLTVQPGAGGTLVSAPAGIDCDGNAPESGSCRAVFEPGTAIELSAQADDGLGVQSWTGICADELASQCRFTLSDDQQVAVNFADAAPLTVSVLSQGQVNSQPAGIDCNAAGGSCTEHFVLGTTVRLQAQPADDHGLLRWTEDCARFISNLECDLSLDQARSATAQFGELFDARIVVSGNGEVDGSGSVIGCEAAEVDTAPCQETYIEGRRVEFTASPQAGNEFLGWGGDCVDAGTQLRCQIDVASDLQIEANFGQVVTQHRLTLVVGGTGGGAGDNDELLFCDTQTSPCSQDYAAGSDVTLFAIPDDSSHSFRWGDDCIGTPDGSNCTISDIARETQVSVEFFDPNANAGDPTLTVRFTGDGAGMVSDNQLKLQCSSSSGSDCSASYPAGTEVTISAFEESTEDRFDGWVGPAECAQNASNNACTLTIQTDIEAVVEFGKIGG